MEGMNEKVDGKSGGKKWMKKVEKKSRKSGLKKWMEKCMK